MHTLWKVGFVLGLVGGITMPTIAIAQAPITQQAQTARYRLDLQIGPFEKMFAPEDAEMKQVMQGEVMIGGKMSMPKDMTTAHHLEIHVHALDSGDSVMDADLTIAVSDASKAVQQIPVATMYGIAEGLGDIHYGNNIDMPPGNYTIDVTVNGEKAEFAVAIPS